jgi:transcription antitermination factor NusG
MEAQWHVVRVSSRTEKKVSEKLKNQGINVYLPLQRQLHQWSDRKKWVDTVVVSGYLFVRITEKEQLLVLQTPGVSCFLKHCQALVHISDSDMQRFRDFIERAEDRPLEFTTEKPPVGTFVTIQNGHFKGFSGEVFQHRGKSKLSVKLADVGHCVVTLFFGDVLPQ